MTTQQQFTLAITFSSKDAMLDFAEQVSENAKVYLSDGLDKKPKYVLRQAGSRPALYEVTR